MRRLVNNYFDRKKEQKKAIKILPSKLIWDGLVALREFESRKNCQVDMTSWFDTNNSGVCFACLGGAYALKSLVPPLLHKSLIHAVVDGFSDSQHIIGNLELALNSARQGEIGNLFSRIGLRYEDGHPFARHITNYRIDRKRFYSEMEELATELQQAGF